MAEQSNRTVVVTGGARGIGRAICVALAAANDVVCFNYARDTEAAATTQAAIEAAGARAHAAQVDVASFEAVDAFFKDILARTGRIDVLVNNAGIARDGLLVRMKDEDWNRVLDTNLKGAFHCTKVAAKTMLKQRRGCIINISSIVGISGNPGQANYVASKAGLIGFTKAVARELASRGIRVNAVAPGYVQTDMTAALSDRAREAMLAQIPLGRAATAEDVSAVVAFLASEGAAYITGQVIHVSGGMYM